MKSKSAIFELILALSVLIAGLLAGCKSMPDTRSKAGPSANSADDRGDLAKLMHVGNGYISHAGPEPKSQERPAAKSFPKVEQSWSEPLGREALPTPGTAHVANARQQGYDNTDYLHSS